MIKRELTTIGLALLTALVAGSVLIWFIGESPLEVYGLLITSTWGTSYGVGQVLFKTTPLILTGLSVAIAFKVGLFNIGAEGQLVVGSLATALCGAALPASTPGPIAVVACIAAGVAAGGLLGAIPGVLKAYYGAHEVINTIMLNFIASAMVLWAGNELLFVEHTTRTERIIDSAQLTPLGFQGSAANTSLAFALVLAVGVHLFLTRTRRGFEWRAVGHNPRAAENAGVNVPRAVIGAMTLSGALAGAVGAHYVLGYKHYFEKGIGTGVGFMGIAVALLGRNHPVGVVLAALLFGTLSHGGLEVSELVPKELVDILQAVIILAVAAAAAYMYRAGLRKGAAAAAGAGAAGAVTSAAAPAAAAPDTVTAYPAADPADADADADADAKSNSDSEDRDDG